MFIISDFLDPDDSFILKMKLLARKHDIIPVQVSDPLEKEVGFFGLTEFVDLETGKVFLSDAIPEKGNFPGAVGVQRDTPEHRRIDRDPHPEILRKAEPDPPGAGLSVLL